MPRFILFAAVAQKSPALPRLLYGGHDVNKIFLVEYYFNPL